MTIANEPIDSTSSVNSNSTELLDSALIRICEIYREYINFENESLNYVLNTKEERMEFFTSLYDLLEAHVLGEKAHRVVYTFLQQVNYHAQSKEFLDRLEQLEDCPVKIPSPAFSLFLLNEIKQHIKSIRRIKNLYPAFTLKQIIAKVLFDLLKDPKALATEPFYPIILNVLKIAERSFEEQQYEQFALIMCELIDPLESNSEAGSIVKILNILDYFDYNDENGFYRKNALQPNPILSAKPIVNTPPSLLKLLQKKGFQPLHTHYCTGISALVNTYILIHQQVAIHEENGLTLEHFYKAFTELIQVDPDLFQSPDLAQNMINAFYASKFYKSLIKTPDYAQHQFIMKGPLDFSQGSSFAKQIQDVPGTGSFTSLSLEVRKYLQHLLNIAAYSVVDNTQNSFFRMRFLLIDRMDPDEDLIPERFVTPAKVVSVKWFGSPHSALKIPEGIINSPTDVIEFEDFHQFGLLETPLTPFYSLQASLGSSNQNVMEPPLSTSEPLSLDVQDLIIEPHLQKRLNQLLRLCTNYKKHLSLQRNLTDVKAQHKLEIVDELLAVLEKDESLSYNSRIEQFKEVLSDEKIATLKERRDSSLGALFVEQLLNILSLGLYSAISKGDFRFWKSHGHVFNNQVSQVLITEETQNARNP